MSVNVRVCVRRSIATPALLFPAPIIRCVVILASRVLEINDTFASKQGKTRIIAISLLYKLS